MSNQLHFMADQPVSDRYRLASRAQNTLAHDDLATELLKDFNRQDPLTVRSSEDIHAIGKKLELSRETMCVVINRKDDVIGMLHMKDLIGSLPMSLASQRRSSIADLVAQDVMRPVWSLPTIGFSKLQSQTVDDLLSIFRELRSDYLLVTETVAGEEGNVVRGLLSADELSRRLGVQVNAESRPESFSDIVHAVRKTMG
ncbi:MULTISPECIES: CBS domain-containing protein [unclassified Marinobacter]|jgi:Mg2+/Co2+ transporter CorC|uniref:CBS domain-containing protein n=1 Tax=unclassified Marinobacter TaxID=83889 RepID=UPI0020109D33|nr:MULTISPECIES: CBS domain-containing protein [unclassified Marinobacter]MCL1477786.1 CBS domain-containing protein [Marinobacter sp.]MCL1481247.1 CBS domain-containing protein [Marinobacter sp.]MCL1484728.1 CBS domain-containing protein [Marinobacter sp.]UQG57464.1 CBS domain-containing protein [Marinobacter sp. M4C]UQG66269.1 CBS domain-containing protein [Marinobacter sp. M2C]